MTETLRQTYENVQSKNALSLGVLAASIVLEGAGIAYDYFTNSVGIRDHLRGTYNQYSGYAGSLPDIIAHIGTLGGALASVATGVWSKSLENKIERTTPRERRRN